jgi:hypothetical protein
MREQCQALEAYAAHYDAQVKSFAYGNAKGIIYMSTVTSVSHHVWPSFLHGPSSPSLCLSACKPVRYLQSGQELLGLSS